MTKAKAAEAASPAPSPSADDLEALKVPSDPMRDNQSCCYPASPENTPEPFWLNLQVPELRAIAKERSLKGYSKLRKAELIELLTAGAKA